VTLATRPLRLALTAGPRWELSVVGAGLACCAVELLAAALDADEGRDPAAAHLRLAEPATGDAPAEASVLVVSGTVTRAGADALRALHASLPGPVHVVSFGSCANSGGPYWDSYAVVPGAAELFPVDVMVPGCPPRPEALLDGLLVLQRQLASA
jgi:NADH-quinone oxidoreductase subunit B